MASNSPADFLRWKSSTSAVIFCGGKSSRMGVDKALLTDAQGRSMLERAHLCLAPLAAEVLLACGPAARYGELGLSLVLDRRLDGGPLGALEASLERSNSRWLAVLACDMPNATTATLVQLLERAQAEDLDVCSLATQAGLEPLCAVYSRACLEAVRAALDCGERRMVSFHAFASNGRALRIARVNAGEPDVAHNLNTPKDWDDFQSSAR